MPTQTWLLLGAGSAVARAFARVAASHGAALLLAGRDTADLELCAQDARVRAGVPVSVLPFDAHDCESHRAFVSRCLVLAQGQLSVFVAIGLLSEQSLLDANPALVRDVVSANYLAVLSVLTELRPAMRSQRGGAIIVLGSVAGDRGRRSNYVYGSAKAGLHAYLSGLRSELHSAGVRVVTVKPGFIDTAMTWGRPRVFLAAAPEGLAEACWLRSQGGSEVFYYPSFWRLIMLAIRLLPECLFKRLPL